MRQLSALNRYFFKYRFRLSLGILFVSLSNIFGVFPPQVIRFGVDLIKDSVELYRLFEGHLSSEILFNLISSYLLFFGFVVLVLALIKGLFMYYTRQTIIFMSRLIEYDMKNELFAQYQRLSQSFFRKNSTGNLMSRISEDVGKVRMYVGPAVMYGLNMLVTSIMVIGAMVQVNAKLTLYVLLPLPALAVGIYYLNNLILKRSGAIQQKLGELTTFSQESYSGIRVIKSLGLTRHFEERMNKELDDYRQQALLLVKADALFFPLTLLLIGASTIITVYIGGLQMIAGEISAGNIAEFVIYVNLLTWPVTSVGWIASMVQQAAASQERINNFMKLEPEIEKEVGEKKKLYGQIELRNVSFRFPESGIQAIKNISIRLLPGQTLGIVGRTASGKTTLAQLLLRHFDPDEGEIVIDNLPLKEWHAGNLREQIGFVPQEAFLFSDTIANNIGFSKDFAGKDEIEEVAKLAAVDEAILALPQKYETVVGERGVTLSGGQKQRVAIARALLGRKPLYIFDDCLSALDTATEHQILENLRRYTKQQTSIIISHRISSVMDADHILVLDAGAIVEEGKHEDLINKHGYYARLWSMQQPELTNRIEKD